MKLTMTKKRAKQIVGDLIKYDLSGEYKPYLKTLSLIEMTEANEVVKRIGKTRTVQWVDGKKKIGWKCYVRLSDESIADSYSGLHGGVSLDDIQTFTSNASDALGEYDEKPIRFVTDGDYCWFEDEDQNDFTNYGTLDQAISEANEKIEFAQNERKVSCYVCGNDFEVDCEIRDFNSETFRLCGGSPRCCP